MKIYREGPETERLRLRAMTVDDTEAFFRMRSDEDVIRYTHEEPLPSLEAAREMVAAYPDFDEHGFGRWGAVLKATGEVIGFAGLKVLPELGGRVDIGYRFFPEHWGKGLATEAGHACLSFGFDTLGLDEIIGLVLPGNTASVRVLEKLGMRDAGTESTDGIVARLFVLRRAEFALGEADG